MMNATQIVQTTDAYLGSAAARVKSHELGIVSGLSGLLTAVFAGAGNYTNQYSATTFSAAAGGLQDSYAFLLDCLTGMGNWYVTNAMGQLYIAMACFMFTFILIKSLFRHSGGRKR